MCELNRRLVTRLREMAKQGATVRMMVGEICNQLNYPSVDQCPALVFDRYFHKSFPIGLGVVRHIEGCAWRGGLYSDEEIDTLILPRIAATRHLWETDPPPK